MLVLPYQTRLNARNLPLVTLTLVLLNALVYLVLQSGDQRHFESAGKLYAAASLATIEAPRYQEWLRQRDDRAGLARLAALQKQPGQLLLLIESDAEFARALRAGRVIVPGDPQYAGWREARRRVDSELDRSFTRSFGLVADGGWLRYLSYQFLHGSLGHLVGNMLVLLLAGPFAEAALGRARFLGAYLAAGVAGGFAHVMLSPSLLVGASAAMAGAMAMVAVLYGKRRVRVFYWLFVYFDTAKVPALALLPVWMLNELAQWAISGGESQVAYSAHLGGIAAGALLAWLLQPRDRARIDRLVAAEFAEDDRTERRSNLLRQAQEAAARLDTRRAARLYGELADQHPDNPEYLIAYLNTALLSPDGELLSDAALRVLWFRGKRISEDLRKAFLQIAQPRLLSLLPVDEQLRLSRQLVRARGQRFAARAGRHSGRCQPAYPVRTPDRRLLTGLVHHLQPARAAPTGRCGAVPPEDLLPLAQRNRRHRPQQRPACDHSGRPPWRHTINLARHDHARTQQQAARDGHAPHRSFRHPHPHQPVAQAVRRRRGDQRANWSSRPSIRCASAAATSVGCCSTRCWRMRRACGTAAPPACSISWAPMR